MPVFSRPPWVKISQRSASHSPRIPILASMATTMHWLPNLSAASAMKSGIPHRRRVDRHFVGAGQKQLSDVGDLAHAAADGQRHEALLGGAGDDVEDGFAIFGRGGDVEEAELVGAGGVIGLGRLDRIAGIDQVDEIDAFDDAAVLDVETGDDAGLQHQILACAARKSPSNCPTTGGTSPLASKAGS